MAKSLASRRMTTAWRAWSTVSPRFQRRRSASRSVVTPDAMVPELVPVDSTPRHVRNSTAGLVPARQAVEVGVRLHDRPRATT